MCACDGAVYKRNLMCAGVGDTNQAHLNLQIPSRWSPQHPHFMDEKGEA